MLQNVTQGLKWSRLSSEQGDKSLNLTESGVGVLEQFRNKSLHMRNEFQGFTHFSQIVK